MSIKRCFFKFINSFNFDFFCFLSIGVRKDVLAQSTTPHIILSYTAKLTGERFYVYGHSSQFRLTVGLGQAGMQVNINVTKWKSKNF